VHPIDEDLRVLLRERPLLECAVFRSHSAVNRVIVVADSPAASLPSSDSSAGFKSPVDSPRKYRTGNTSSAFGERRMYGGKIALVKRCPGRRSATRSAVSSIVPLPTVILRSFALPLRRPERVPAHRAPRGGA
jgi:hypothetical protein